MIADGDSVARNAFRVGLREDTPLPVSSTQELDPGDVLEVQDMAAAIARAEKLVAAPRSSRPARVGLDMFESLGRRPTDDAVGPATPAPPGSYPAYLPPANSAAATTLLRPAPAMRVIPGTIETPAPTPYPMVLSIPNALPAPEDDAYFHPAGRMRSLADATLEGYRPEPTLLMRARARRRHLSWIMVAVLLPLVVLAAFALLAHDEAAAPPPSVSTTTIATASLETAPAVKPAPTSAGVPVFDVNSLPTATGKAAVPATR